jgi:hypothetical protein
MMERDEELYDASGVDITLVRWFLKLTPAERMENLQEFINFTEEIWRLNGIAPPDRNPKGAGWG